MAINFVGITRKKFLSEYERIYRFTNLERFIEALSTNSFTFVNPSKWPDPYERFFLERNFNIANKEVYLPAKDNIFSVCLSGTLSSEAYWKVYAPKEDGVRLTFNTEKLLSTFLEKIKNCEVYIGKVNYQVTKEFFKISFDTGKLIQEIEDNKVGDQQIRLLLKKRKSFLYENEIRILIVPKSKQNNNIYNVDTDITQFTSGYTLDPRLGKNLVKVLKEYFLNKYTLEISHSLLYADKRRKTIVLKTK